VSAGWAITEMTPTGTFIVDRAPENAGPRQLSDHL